MDASVKINIVFNSSHPSWILGKFADKLVAELIGLGYNNTERSDYANSNANINHYIWYGDFLNNKANTTFNSVLITHVDSYAKKEYINSILSKANIGICMSKYTQQLLYKAGVEPSKLFYVNPAHDEIFKPYKRIIGLNTNVYKDGRKNEHYLLEAIGRLNKDFFKFIIIGDEGWSEIVQQLTKNEFEVEHYPFEYESYKKILPTFDYCFYFGNDEGSMGVLDALHAGIPVVTTPQGFHLDFNSTNIHFISNKKDFDEYLVCLNKQITENYYKTEEWTWKNYALKHLEIWEYNLYRKNTSLTTFRYRKDGVQSSIKRKSRFYLHKRKLLIEVPLRLYNNSPEFVKGAYRIVKSIVRQIKP